MPGERRIHERVAIGEGSRVHSDKVKDLLVHVNEMGLNGAKISDTRIFDIDGTPTVDFVVSRD